MDTILKNGGAATVQQIIRISDRLDADDGRGGVQRAAGVHAP